LALKNTGYSVEARENGSEAFLLATTSSFDAIVLDIMVPGMDGFQFLSRLRQRGDTTPVLCLTARDALEDRVKGLNSGADDYLVKPFELRELLARVNALCRRKHHQYTNRLRVGDLELDRESRKVFLQGGDIQLQPREYAILEHLMLHPGLVISRNEIEQRIYSDLDAPESNAVDSAICALRRKLSCYPGAPPLIHTRRGHGYEIADGAA
jgi:two-component system OmpR family response regulator